MIPARYLLDTSALVRLLRNADVRAAWEHQVTAGLVAVCPVVELEFLHTARSVHDRSELASLLGTAFGWVDVPERAFTRAAEVQQLMTERGTHRSAGMADLLVASTAELHQLTLVHYDRDFMQVAEVTGQKVGWVSRGSRPAARRRRGC